MFEPDEVKMEEEGLVKSEEEEFHAAYYCEQLQVKEEHARSVGLKKKRASPLRLDEGRARQ